MLTPRQHHCLRGMGIQVWRERDANDGNGVATDPVPALLGDDELDALNRFIDPAQAETVAQDGDRPRFSPDSESMDKPLQEKRGLSPDSNQPAPVAEQPAATPPPILDSWDSIIESIHACSACELSQNCTQKVPGVGDRQADLLIVGEGPGHDEDIQGEPFVGRSGQLLDRMLAAIGISREQVYITNVVKCRPPNNRDPKPEESLHCRLYLDAQIKQIKPKVILSVGRVSAHNLLGVSDPVGKMIKVMHQLPDSDIPVKVTYHPAYLLRNPSAKAIAWQDMKLLHQMLQ